MFVFFTAMMSSVFSGKCCKPRHYSRQTDDGCQQPGPRTHIFPWRRRPNLFRVAVPPFSRTRCHHLHLPLRLSLLRFVMCSASTMLTSGFVPMKQGKEDATLFWGCNRDLRVDLVSGWMCSGPPPEPNEQPAAADDDRAPPPRKAEKARRKAEKASTATGIVASFHKSRHGDIDGLRLDDGTEVRFPAAASEKPTGVVSLKDRVAIEGWMHPGNPKSTPPRSRMRRRASSSMSIGRRRQLGWAAKDFAAQAAKRRKPTTDGRPRALRKGVQTAGRGRGPIARPEGTKGDNTRWNKPCRTRPSSTRSPSTGWPS